MSAASTIRAATTTGTRSRLVTLTAQRTALQCDGTARAADRERAWATRPEIVEAAAYAKRGEAPPGAIEAAERARAELLSQPGTSATITGLRDNIYYAAKWYYDYQTITYTWSDYWTPCNMYEADCECFNRRRPPAMSSGAGSR